MNVEIKRKPVNNPAKVVKLIEMYNDKGIWSPEKIFAFVDKIDSFYNSDDTGEIEEIKCEGQDTGIVVTLSFPFVGVKTYSTKDGEGYSVTFGRHGAREFVNALLAMCEQIE